jgi:hypothetical protein
VKVAKLISHPIYNQLSSDFCFETIIIMSGNSSKTPLHTSAKIGSKAQQQTPSNNNNSTNDDITDNNKRQNKTTRTKQPTSPWVYVTLLVFACITYFTMPVPLQPHHGEEPSIKHVFYYGWLTAISTGLGAIPLVFAPNLASYWVGISNGKLLVQCSYDEILLVRLLSLLTPMVLPPSQQQPSRRV